MDGWVGIFAGRGWIGHCATLGSSCQAVDKLCKLDASSNNS